MAEVVAVCLSGCRLRSKDGGDLGPRQLTAAELWAHEDKHLPSKVRVLVRMLREATPGVRRAVLEYWVGPLPSDWQDMVPLFAEEVH